MADDHFDQARSTAVKQLQALGLSTYAARTYVSLVQLGTGTAKDVDSLSEVPRTRVYDAVEELQEHGLVDVQQSSPKKFRPVSVETAGRHFELEYIHRVETMTEALTSLETDVTPEEQRGVWTFTGRDTVTERVQDMLDSATDEVVFMTVGELLTDGLIDRLRAASDRGVTIKLAGMSGDVEDLLRDEVPDTEFFESMWVWSNTPAGRLLMVDQTKTLVSVLPAGDDGSGLRDETAIWGTGKSNNLVVVLEAMFTWQLNGTRR